MTTECKHCDDTGSMSQSLQGDFDCHHCGRADENLRALAWMNENLPQIGHDDVRLAIYYKGKADGRRQP